MLRFGVISLFPEAMRAMLEVGVLGRAIREAQVQLHLENPRDFAQDRHRTVDDRPFGGGPGMVMRPEPLAAAIAAAHQAQPGLPVVCLGPQGQRFDQALAERWKQQGGRILICGRYEGIDERVIDAHVDEEVSLGDFVLSGGEVAALAMIDACARLVPGVLGHPESAQADSFGAHGLLDCPHYTRPDVYQGQAVPAVLLSGDHAAIAQWRREQALERTWQRRPELLDQAELSEAEKRWLEQRRQDAASVD